jgi:thiol-disulfide isomerase/thioredoxin
MAARPTAALAAMLLATTVALAAAPGVDELRRLAVRRHTDAPVSLASLLGDRPALVAFWATWCAPCQAEVPVLRRAVARYGGRGLKVIGIAIDHDGAEGVARAVAEWGIDYEVAWVPAADAARLRTLLPEGLPATYAVGSRGAERLDGALSDRDVDRLVAPLLLPQE